MFSSAEDKAKNQDPPAIVLSIVNFIVHNRPLVVDNSYFMQAGKNNDCYQIATDYIKHSIRLAGNHQNAALILFELLRSLAFRQHELPRAHVDILTAMNRDDLSLHYMGKIFAYLLTRDELVNTQPAIEAPSVEKSTMVSITSGVAKGLWHYASSAVQSAAFKSTYSPAWQETMSKIRQVALCKLRTEVAALEDLNDQVKYLEAAKTMLIFKEHQSNSTLTGGYGDTNAVIEINNLLEVVRARMNDFVEINKQMEDMKMWK